MTIMIKIKALTKTQKIIALVGGFLIFAEIVAYLAVTAFRQQKTQEVISEKANGMLMMIEIRRKHSKLEDGSTNSNLGPKQ